MILILIIPLDYEHIIKEPEVLHKIIFRYFYSYGIAVPNSKFEFIILARSSK